jgi:hypothetical protein
VPWSTTLQTTDGGIEINHGAVNLTGVRFTIDIIRVEHSTIYRIKLIMMD